MSKKLSLHRDLEPTEYHEGFKEFLARTDQKQVSLEWFKVHFNNRTDIKRVLSIGCGEGSFDLLLLKILPNVQTYVGIDPNPSHISSFQHRYENESLPSYPSMRLVQARFEEVGLSPEVDVELLQQDFEDFRTDQRYDLIIMSQVLYYIPQRKFALSKACTLLNDDGILIVLHKTERGIYALQKRYGRTRLSYNAVELAKDLDTLGIPYCYEELDSYVNLDEISAPLIRFFLESTVTKSEADDVRQYLLRQYPEKQLPHPIGIFVISAHDLR